MGLLQNVARLSAEPLNLTGGVSALCTLRSNFTRPERQLSKYTALDHKVGIPYGYVHPIAIAMPLKDGGMSAYTDIQGVGTTTNSLNMGINLVAPVSGNGALGPALVGIAHMLSSIYGAGSVPVLNIQCPL